MYGSDLTHDVGTSDYINLFIFRCKQIEEKKKKKKKKKKKERKSLRVHRDKLMEYLNFKMKMINTF